MKHQVDWGKGKPGEEDVLFAAQADTAAFYGHIKEAEDWSERAMQSVEQAGSRETAALYETIAAVRDAEVENRAQAERQAQAALELNGGKGVRILSALALARAGNAARAEKISREVAESSPSDTTLKFYWLPFIRAAIQLPAHPAKALELLEQTAQYDLGEVPPINCLCSIYFTRWRT